MGDDSGHDTGPQAVDIRDMDEEKLLRHFVLEDQAKEVIAWCDKNYGKRPTTAKERMSGATELRTKGNKLVEKQNYQAALFCYMSSLYFLDFNLKDKREIDP